MKEQVRQHKPLYDTHSIKYNNQDVQWVKLEASTIAIDRVGKCVQCEDWHNPVCQSPLDIGGIADLASIALQSWTVNTVHGISGRTRWTKTHYTTTEYFNLDVYVSVVKNRTSFWVVQRNRKLNSDHYPVIIETTLNLSTPKCRTETCKHNWDI